MRLIPLKKARYSLGTEASMTWSRELLVSIVTAVALSACGGPAAPASEPVGPVPRSEEVSVRPSAEAGPIASTERGVASTPAPTAAATPTPPPPEGLAALVRESPCDILPETGDIVGAMAHDRGYPRLSGHEISFEDSTSPHLTPDRRVVLALTGGTTYANEAHDCQRLVLIQDGDSSFGPLVGLLPLHEAMDSDDADFVGGKVVGTVYNWGDFQGQPQVYHSLRIADGWNCLWIRRDSGPSWRAAITPDEPKACFERIPPDPSHYTLDVQRAHHAASMPKTARWGWHRGESVHIIGIKCGRAWCWVGQPGLFTADSVRLVGDAHRTIPGYFDEQHLAVPDGSGGIKPGPVGVLTPSQAFYHLAALQRVFEDIDLFSLPFRGGLTVARIDLPGLRGATPEPYATRWGVQQTPVGSQRPVTVRLQIPQTQPTFIALSTFRNANGRIGRSVRPIPRSGVAHAALGAVRWRWHDTSSTASIWSGCGVRGQDCCDTQ